MVRLIGDGGMSFYIKDFAVIPHIKVNELELYLWEVWENT